MLCLDHGRDNPPTAGEELKRPREHWNSGANERFVCAKGGFIEVLCGGTM